jgi:hypothetical protein
MSVKRDFPRKSLLTEQSMLYSLVPLCATVIIEVTAYYVILWRAHAKSNARSFTEKLKYHKVDLPDCYSTSRG